MIKFLISLFLLISLLSAKVEVVQKWVKGVYYGESSIVFCSIDDSYYLSLKSNNGILPIDSNTWVKIEHFRDALPFKADSLYQLGSAIIYNDKIYVAGKDGKYPQKDDDWGAWVMATGVLSTLPKDPGLACDTTLLGIDSDRDGIRDDLQREITLLFPNDYKARAGVLGQTMSYQIAFKELNSNSYTTFDDLKLFDAILSISLDHYIWSAQSIISYDYFESLIFNTPERIMMSNNINNLFSTKIIPCDGFPEYREQAEQILNEILEREKRRQQY